MKIEYIIIMLFATAIFGLNPCSNGMTIEFASTDYPQDDILES